MTDERMLETPVLKAALEEMLEAVSVRHCIFAAGTVDNLNHGGAGACPRDAGETAEGATCSEPADSGAKETGDTAAGVVMRGRFAFHNHSGLSMHCTDGVETQNLSSVTELPPGLSFNLLFNGSVDFSLGGRRHRLGARGLNPIECSGFALARPEMMTRFTRSGAHVHKMNIFVRENWLNDRCQSDTGLAQLQRLFASHGTPHFWAADEEVVLLAQRLMNFQTAQSFREQLQQEQLTIELLARCIDAFDQQLEAQKGEQIAAAPAGYFRLKEQVDEKLRDCRGLEDIAEALGVSVSTLQRKFKAVYGTTVIDYVRRRRLEIARTAITMDGLSIGEAAYLAGYNHASNFVAAFKKVFNVTPAQLVRSHRRLRRLEPV